MNQYKWSGLDLRSKSRLNPIFINCKSNWPEAFWTAAADLVHFFDFFDGGTGFVCSFLGLGAGDFFGFFGGAFFGTGAFLVTETK